MIRRQHSSEIVKAEEIVDPSLPKDFLVAELREKRHFRFLARKLGFFASYFVVYLMILALQRDVSSGYLLNQTVHDSLTKSSSPTGVSFDDISNMGDYWDWIQGTFIPNVYAQTWYNGDLLDEDLQHTIGTQTKLNGGFRILQSRRVNGVSSACYSTVFDNFTKTCVHDKNGESEEPFGNPAARNTSDFDGLDMFNYSEHEDGTSGYQHRFGWSSTRGVDELALLQKMKTQRWIDHYTKSVSVDLTMYNNNLKLWLSSRLTITFDLAGGIRSSSQTRVINVEPYSRSNNRALARSSLEIVYFVLVIYYFLQEIYDIVVLSKGSLTLYNEKYGLANNVSELFHIWINFVIIFWWYEFINHPIRKQLLTTTDFSNYIDIFPLSQWEDKYMSVNTMNVLYQTVRSLKFFQVTGGGLRLIRSLFEAGPEVASFMPIFFTALAGYTFAGHFLYGLRYKEWSTWDGAFFRVYEINFGLYDPNDIYDSGGAVSALFIYTGTIIICVVMLNVFLAIVMTTWDSLADQAKEMEERCHLKVPSLSMQRVFAIMFMKEDQMDSLVQAAKKLEAEHATQSEFGTFLREQPIKITEVNIRQCLSWFWKPTVKRGILSNRLSIGKMPGNKKGANYVIPVAATEDEGKDTSVLQPSTEQAADESTRIQTAGSLKAVEPTGKAEPPAEEEKESGVELVDM